MSDNRRLQSVPVPPPGKVRIDDRATHLGLVTGLRVKQSRDAYRCGLCGQMQQADTPLVWVPDWSVRIGDPAWSITEQCRQAAYNGDWGGWCIGCARRLTEAARGSERDDAQEPDDSAVAPQLPSRIPRLLAGVLIGGCLAALAWLFV